MFGFFKKFAEAGEIRKAAYMGDAEAQFRMGKSYYNVQGVRTDYENVEAAKWFRKAAELNHAKAQGCLGVCYATGEGVPKDSAQAAYWYHKAAEQGDAFS